MVENMTLLELKQRIDAQLELMPKAANLEVVIPVWKPGSMGGTPCVKTESAGAGFDWNNGKYFINPVYKLTELTA